jgi:hypothetical protein
MARSDYLGEGFRTVRDEILGAQWPDNVHLQLLIEVVFYAGATWLMKVIADEGISNELLAQINDELFAHTQKARAMKQALDENKENQGRDN